ncbi:MAG: delta-60 repeat domain-containing protein [Deltaproteobacteria bacterium]|nr:delta-60 repeat domain-containing protein [Deltaproteobacteria bacterium]
MRDERLFGGTTINPFLAKTHLPGLRRTWRLLTVCLAALGLLLAFLSPAAAGDGALDPTFNNFKGVQKLPILRNQADYVTDNTPSGTTTGVSLICGYFTSITDSSGTYPNISGIAKLLDTAGTVDTTFHIPIVGEVRTILLSDNISTTSPILIGGNFSVAGSDNIPYYNLARLTNSGSGYAVDITFPHIFNQVVTGSGSNIPVSAVNTIALQGVYATGYILVGGYNLQVQGDASNHAYHLIRLNPGTSLSPYTWDSAYSAANPARALPGGNVNGINLSDTNFLNQARIFGTLPKVGGGIDYMELTDTSLSTIVAGLGSGQMDGQMFSMSQVNGLWVIVGEFKNVFGFPLNGVARLKADLSDLDSRASGSFNYNISNLGGAGLHSVNQIWGMVMGGNITTFNGATCGKLVRLTSTGTVDGTFNPGGIGLDDRPWRIYQPKSSTNFQILGAFRHYNGTANPRGGIATLNSNGVLQPNYANLSTISTTPGTVYAMEWDQSGFIIGGDFTGVGGKWHPNLARLNWDGSVDPEFLHNVDGVVHYLRQAWTGSTNNDMLVAGNFGAADGVGCTSLARYNMNSSMGPYNYPNTTYSLDYNFRPAVTRADGTLGTVKMANANDNAPHNIMVGGNFDKVNGTGGLNSVALLASTGALVPGFTFTPPQGLSNIRVNAGGSMGTSYVMAGKANYTDPNNSSSPVGFGWQLTSIGALDTSFAINQSPVPNVALFDAEVINGGGPHGDGPSPFFLCGNFTHVSDLQGFNIPRGYIARFNANGTLDTTWAPTTTTNGPINALDVESNGKIIIGGAFSQYNSTPRSGVARLNAGGSLDLSFDPGSGATGGPVYLVNWDAYNGIAFIGGSFTTYNGAFAPGFARIIAGPRVRPGAVGSLLLLLGD